MSVPADSEAITPKWLTAVLHEAGALDQARVTSIESAPIGQLGFTGQIWRLQIGYDKPEPGAPHGELQILDGAAHLAPAEAPQDVAKLIIEHCDAQGSGADRYAAGMQVRREVLGDDHVDRATTATTDFTRDFQQLITEYAWGTIWTRPGLDRRSRSMITLTALVARGHYEELAMHIRAARRNGLSVDEIKEVLLQTAIYCGVPDANTAFRIAQAVLADEETTPEEDDR